MDSFIDLIIPGHLLIEPEELGKVQKFYLYMLMDYDKLTVNTEVEIYSIERDEVFWTCISGLFFKQVQMPPQQPVTYSIEDSLFPLLTCKILICIKFPFISRNENFSLIEYFD